MRGSKNRRLLSPAGEGRLEASSGGGRRRQRGKGSIPWGKIRSKGARNGKKLNKRKRGIIQARKSWKKKE